MKPINGRILLKKLTATNRFNLVLSLDEKKYNFFQKSPYIGKVIEKCSTIDDSSIKPGTYVFYCDHAGVSVDEDAKLFLIRHRDIVAIIEDETILSDLVDL